MVVLYTEPMLGRRLDNKHPYGVRVATGRDKASPTIDAAAKTAARKADRLLAELAKPSRRGARSRGRNAIQR